MNALTPEEQAIIADANWIYRKNSAMQKVMELLGVLQLALQEHPATAAFHFPQQCLRLGAKLSRGERYKDLPYVMLDYPRYFSQEDIFAFRTMFWWGHYFIATLHLSGSIKEQYAPALSLARPQLAAGGFLLYVREDDPWQHDLGNGNYRAIEDMQAQEYEALVHKLPFIKLAKPYMLDAWEKIVPGVVTDYVLLLQLLRDNS